MKLKHAVQGLLLYWVGGFVGFSIGAVVLLYLLLPFFLFVFHGRSYSLPDPEFVHKMALFVVFCTFTVGTIMWASNEIQLREKSKKDKGPKR